MRARLGMEGTGQAKEEDVNIADREAARGPGTRWFLTVVLCRLLRVSKRVWMTLAALGRLTGSCTCIFQHASRNICTVL